MLTVQNNDVSKSAVDDFLQFLPHDLCYDVCARKGSAFSVCAHNGRADITYTTTAEFFRGLSLLPADSSDFAICEKTNAKNVAFMLDCSRGGVINDANFKKLVKILAAFGYNELQLYTEDTYEVQNEPYFGHLRGRIGIDEWKCWDSYAASFGIELVPCIQTLAHTDNLFIWDEYEKIRDIHNILLIDEERTYQLVDNMFTSLAASFHSRKIHIGYDEAHFVGLGKYYEKHGPTDRTQLILKHLKRVLSIAEAHGFHCMMWSDMFFRLAYGGEYYPGTDVPPLGREVTDLIPKNLTLTYWDYYHTDEATYDNMFRRHFQLNCPISFSTGAWKWLGFAPMNKYGLLRMLPGMKSAFRNKIQDVMLTAWGDNGNECGLYSILPQIVAFGELCRDKNADEMNFTNRLKAVCNVSFADFMQLDLPNAYNNKDAAALSNPAKFLFYNDPMYGLCDYHTDDSVCDWYRTCASKLSGLAGRNGEYSYLFRTEAALCRYLALKANMGNQLRALYRSENKEGLAEYAKNHIGKAIKAFDHFEKEYRTQWRTEWKSFGLDNLQLRFGGQRLRLVETQRRILEYINGKVCSLEELEQPVLPYCYSWEKDLLYKHNYQYIATPSFCAQL